MSIVFPAPVNNPAAFGKAYSLEQFRGFRSCGNHLALGLGGDVLMYDERQRVAGAGLGLGTKDGYGICHSGGKVGFTVQSGAAVYICHWNWRKDIAFVVLPFTKNAHFSARMDRRYCKRAANFGLGRWRSEFSGATEERRSTNFKSENAPANFVSNSHKQGGHSGSSKHEVRGQHDDSTAIPLTGSGLTALSELRGAKAKVIAAGAGASAILNFCQQSSLLPTAQFWYSADVASEPVLLSDSQLSNSTRNGFDDGNKTPLTIQDGNEEIVFLVLGVGSGIGLGTVPEQLKAVRSRGCLTVGIFIQPFLFEGTKRLEQAIQLIDGLLGCTDMLLVVEQDGLLRRDIVTVSEASTLAKNAVLLSIKTIAELLLGKAAVSLDAKIEGNSEISDTMKILRHAGKAWLGSGRGFTAKEALEMAVAEAPISDYRPFGAKRLVLCTLSSAMDQNGEEVGVWKAFLHQTLGPELQLIVSTVKNPVLENNVKLATIIIARVNNQQATSQFSDNNGHEYGVPSMIGINTVDEVEVAKQSLYSSYVSTSMSTRFSPFESSQEKTASLLTGASVAPHGEVGDNGYSSSVNQGKSTGATKIARSSNEGTSSPQKSKQPPPHRSLGKRPLGYTYRSPIREEVKNADAREVPSQASLATNTESQKLRLAWEAGPSSDIAEAWAQARAEAREPTQVTSGLDVSLPVGVRLGTQQRLRVIDENFTSTAGIEVAEDKWSGTDAVPVDPDALPRNRMMDMGLEAMRDMYNAASALVMGRETTDDGRQASLSQRAASMLESERSQKKLTPLVEMGFKNGRYKGRCQRGLPEGKGRLSFSDGSFYDGQWRQGKRAGSGAFYYSNGDMFQGSWKDDVMNGKGWMYYHNGDRLYANFRKGRADGEGRFYSAQGYVFFGQFRENWRHGEFLYIEASGVRWSEIWENGVLQSRTPAEDA